MRLYRVELKRQLKTRSVQLLLLFAFVMTFVFSYCPPSFVQYVYEENGQEISLKGPKATAMIRDDWKEYAGELTEEKLAEILLQYQQLSRQYGKDGIFTSDLPESVYFQKVAPISSMIYRMREVYANPETGIAKNVLELTREDVRNFYSQCYQRLDDVMRMEQSKHPAAIRQAKALYSTVKMPFSFYPGFNSDALDYLVLLIFFLTIVGVVIVSPVFSSDYQTGSDNILRCAKYGRNPLALAKIQAALTITCVMYLVCMGIYLLAEGWAFGWDTLKTSLQLIYSATSFPNLNIGQLMLLCAVAGFFAHLATMLCTLFLSGSRSSVYASTAFSLLLVILPVLTYSFLPGTLELWVRSLLPNGSIGFANSLLYEVLDTNFLHLGGLSLWYPFVLVLGSLLEIPLWLFAAIRAYKIHKQ